MASGKIKLYKTNEIKKSENGFNPCVVSITKKANITKNSE
jgi:hypothetical protein